MVLEAILLDEWRGDPAVKRPRRDANPFRKAGLPVGARQSQALRDGRICTMTCANPLACILIRAARVCLILSQIRSVRITPKPSKGLWIYRIYFLKWSCPLASVYKHCKSISYF